MPHPSDALLDWLVDGQGEKPTTVDYYYCSVERHTGCGPDALFFEPKEQVVA